MNKFLLFSILLFTSSISQAASSSWTKTVLHYNIYASGGWATMIFSRPTSVPISGTSVTSVSYSWQRYPNSNTSEVDEICYSNPNSSTIQYCNNISSSLSGTVHFYDGFSARGSFYIRHTIFGGTYPATPLSKYDTVTVNYNY